MTPAQRGQLVEIPADPAALPDPSSSGIFVEGAADVAVFEEAFEQIVATAQSPDESRETIKKIMEEKYS
ncbi:Scr1 family TA system antitoxin-like transcriptional regulator [Streptomyces sp. NPDC127084]|uniref:Scr1 family TA system antitoxin-like transcriptional regulator n=1 Tax=Streptomyces sp. NPDC127084 TaxID=3347133 RepID=UPI00365EA662